MKTKLIISIIAIGFLPFNLIKSQECVKFNIIGALLDSTTEFRVGTFRICKDYILIRDNYIDKTYILQRLSDTEGCVKSDSEEPITYFMRRYEVSTVLDKESEPALLLLYKSLGINEEFWELHLFRSKNEEGGYTKKVVSYFVIPEEEPNGALKESISDSF